jgi:polysaccharide export outer membrane protein
MLKSLKGLTITLFAVTAFSCVSNEKINYLQNLEGNEPIPEGELIQYEIPEYRLQYNDIIVVNEQTIDDLIEEASIIKLY